MTGTPPPAQPQPKGSRGPGAGSAIWWVVAAVAGVVSVALVVWLLGTLSPSPSTSTSPASPAPATEPSATSSTATEGATAEPSTTEPGATFDFGDFPPAYELKDLSDPVFPEQLEGISLDEVEELGPYLTAAEYLHDPGPGTVYVDWYTGKNVYKTRADGLTDPAFQGRALCGTLIDFPDQVACTMAGRNETLGVTSFTDVVTPAELGALAEAIYDAL